MGEDYRFDGEYLLPYDLKVFWAWKQWQGLRLGLRVYGEKMRVQTYLHAIVNKAESMGP